MSGFFCRAWNLSSWVGEVVFIAAEQRRLDVLYVGNMANKDWGLKFLVVPRKLH